MCAHSSGSPQPQAGPAAARYGAEQHALCTEMGNMMEKFRWIMRKVNFLTEAAFFFYSHLHRSERQEPLQDSISTSPGLQQNPSVPVLTTFPSKQAALQLFPFSFAREKRSSWHQTQAVHLQIWVMVRGFKQQAQICFTPLRQDTGLSLLSPPKPPGMAVQEVWLCSSAAPSNGVHARGAALGFWSWLLPSQLCTATNQGSLGFRFGLGPAARGSDSMQQDFSGVRIQNIHKERIRKFARDSWANLSSSRVPEGC